MDSILLAVVLGLLSLAFVLQPLYTSARATRRSKLTTLHNENDDVASPVVSRGVSLPPPFPPPSAPYSLPVSPTTDLAISTETGQTGESGETGQTEREQAARAALHEVELDYQLGNITEADYRALRERYTRRALRELKARYDHEQELDDLIEQQLQSLKEQDEQIS